LKISRAIANPPSLQLSFAFYAALPLRLRHSCEDTMGIAVVNP
jgi:hypothetical protein